ncbi:MAG: adenosine deaminase [Ilumatobacteraceae bacterium]
MRLDTIPKAEVHVHLEGCQSAGTLAALARRHGEALPRPVDQLFEVADFDEFLDFLSWSCGLLRTADDVAAAAYGYAARLAGTGAVAADLIVNPTHWHTWHDDLRGLIGALDRGLAGAEDDGLPPVGLCVSVLRQQTAAQAAELVETLVALDHPRVVALSIDGNEARAGRTGPRFAKAFAAAGAAGLRRTVHAGESSGPQGVRDAIELLGADRIDHGVRAVEDPALVAELADRGVPLGICPSSNVTLGGAASVAEHPIEGLRLAGVAVSVNTDDPAFLGTDLLAEYRLCVDAFGWDEATVGEVAATSVAACFTARRRGLA